MSETAIVDGNNPSHVMAVNPDGSINSNTTVTPPANQRVSSTSGDFVDGAITTLGQAGDTNTANTAMGRLTKLRDIWLDMWDSTNHWLQVGVKNGNANGQNVMTNSQSVAIASDQTPVAMQNYVRYYALLGKAFWASSPQIATATNTNLTICLMSLFNAANSGKTIEIFSIIPMSQETETPFGYYFRQTTADPGNANGITNQVTPFNSLFGGASSSVSAWSSPTGVTASRTATGTLLTGLATQSNTPTDLLAGNKTIILPNGSAYGMELDVFIGTVGHTCAAIIGYIER